MATRPWTCPWCGKTYSVDSRQEDPETCEACLAEARKKSAGTKPAPVRPQFKSLPTTPTEDAIQPLRSQAATAAPVVDSSWAPIMRGIYRAFVFVAYMGLALLTFVRLGNLGSTLSRAESAPQQAAVAAEAAAFMIGWYIFVRCLEKMGAMAESRK